MRGMSGFGRMRGSACAACAGLARARFSMRGFSRYHGYYSFKEFSHFKPFVKKSTRFDLGLTDPPYDDKKERLVKKALK